MTSTAASEACLSGSAVKCILCSEIFDGNHIEHEIAICPKCAIDSYGGGGEETMVTTSTTSLTPPTKEDSSDPSTTSTTSAVASSADQSSSSMSTLPQLEGPDVKSQCILCSKTYSARDCKHELDICPSCMKDNEEAQMDGEGGISTTQDQRLDPSPALQSTSILARPKNTDEDDEEQDHSTETHFPEGSYVGDVDHNGMPHGRGTMRFSNGTVYEGDWSHSRMSGYGELVMHDSTSYKGEWEDGKPHGIGVQKYINGDVYQGSFKNGLMDGQGFYRYHNNEEYDGEWKDGKQHGRGKFVYRSGNVYEGRFKNGHRNGNGAFTYANGDKFYGNFRNEKKEGRGVYMHKNGILEIKTYRSGKPIEGVRFPSDRDKAWRIIDGNYIEMPLEDAEAYLRDARLNSPFLANYLW